MKHLNKILSIIITLVMFVGILPMTEISKQVLPAFFLTAEAAYASTRLSITGVWDGVYIGHSSGDIARERSISLNIFSCDTNGFFEGVATIDNGDIGSYAFTGVIDYETMKFGFKGNKWIVCKDDNFRFSDFDGIIFENSMTGTVGGNIERTFRINKTSEEYTSYSIDIKNIPKFWEGEYDGHSDGTTVRRIISINISDIDAEGNATGTAVISPSEKADAYYGANGSYCFSAYIDSKFGTISFQGKDWIEFPVNQYRSFDNFSFVKLNGRIINDSNASISGYSEDGIWQMSAVKDSYSVDSGFKLLRDNNNFIHEADSFPEDKPFYINNYYLGVLKNYCTPSEYTNIKEMINSKTFGGSCYGIACSMGALFNNNISISEITDGAEDCYYKLNNPRDNEKFASAINCYQFSQFTTSCGIRNISVAYTLNPTLIQRLLHFEGYYHALSPFLKKLVECASSGDAYILCYIYSGGGHAVVVTGCERDNDQYKVKIYDENSYDENSYGDFIYMTISSDFSTFSLIDANGKKINKKTFKSMYLIDLDDVPLISKKSQDDTDGTGNVTSITVDSETSYEIKSDDNTMSISYADGEFSGDMTIASISPIIYSTTDGNDNNVGYTFSTTENRGFVIEVNSLDADITIQNDEYYTRVEGNGIDQIEYNTDGTISLSGDDYSFDVTMSSKDLIDENEYGLGSVSGIAADEVSIASDGQNIIAKSDSTISDVKTQIYTWNGVVSESLGSTNFVNLNTYSNNSNISSVIIGDVNGDGKVTASDARLVLRYSARLEAFTDEQISIADVDMSGIVTAADARYILRYSAKLESSLPVKNQ